MNTHEETEAVPVHRTCTCVCVCMCVQLGGTYAREHVKRRLHCCGLGGLGRNVCILPLTLVHLILASVVTRIIYHEEKIACVRVCLHVCTVRWYTHKMGM